MSTAKPPAPHRRTTSLNKTKVLINCYDLLPPSTLTTLLWPLGLPLLHSGVVLSQREYAYGSHTRPNTTGVYTSQPSIPPPGATHKLTHFHGFTILSEDEISQVIKDVSRRFLGTEWDLVRWNCNHFVSVLCEELTGVPAPGWLNRAARGAGWVPCLVPGIRVGVGEEESDEEAGMLSDFHRESALLEDVDEEEDRERRRRGGGGRARGGARDDDTESEEETEEEGGSQYTSDESEDERDAARRREVHRRHGERLRPPVVKRGSGKGGGGTPRGVDVRDTSGRTVPVSERAPMP